jgi:hypothetical protein
VRTGLRDFAGIASTRLRRALDHSNLVEALSAAAELDHVALVEALELCLLFANREPAKVRAGCLRWHGRYCREAPGVGFGEAQVILAVHRVPLAHGGSNQNWRTSSCAAPNATPPLTASVDGRNSVDDDRDVEGGRPLPRSGSDMSSGITPELDDQVAEPIHNSGVAAKARLAMDVPDCSYPLCHPV